MRKRRAVPTSEAPSLSDWPELAHILFYGQSLSLGFLGIPALSTKPTPLGLRFSGGVRGLDDPPHAYDDFAPLFETNASMCGETPATACAAMITQLLEQENGLSVEALPFRLLFSAPGESGKTIADLSVGTANFERVKYDLLFGACRAHERNKTYALSAVAWIQGEADYDRGCSGEAYGPFLRRLHADLNGIATGMAGRHVGVPLLVTQTTTHRLLRKAVPDIALAQLACAQDPDVALVCSPYALPFWPNDLHMTALGYQWLGAYYGLALKRWLWDGIKPGHLRPLGAAARGDAVELTFEAPGERLVLDDEEVEAQPAAGFAVVNEAGDPLEIVDVALTGPKTLELRLSEPAKGGLGVRYGWGGAESTGVGNLRDDQGDRIAFEGGRERLPLHNWCPIFEIEAA